MRNYITKPQYQVNFREQGNQNVSINYILLRTKLVLKMEERNVETLLQMIKEEQESRVGGAGKEGGMC
jgi:hypothetical protein